MTRIGRSTVALLLLSFRPCGAFLNRCAQDEVLRPLHSRCPSSAKKSALFMAKLDPVTFLRTEYISAAICTNQIPRAADVCLQLGTQDGRSVTFVPKTIREIITSSAEADGVLAVSTRRQLKQNKERRGTDVTITYADQPADDLRETATESVDVVISLQSAELMVENGLSWKRSVREASRVLKPGGRLIFVEKTELNGEAYLEYIENLTSASDDDEAGKGTGAEDDRVPMFDDVGSDDVDLVLTPHVAGVAIKALDAGLTPAERAQKKADEESDRIAELSFRAYERGNKKRKRKRKKAKGKKDD